MNSSNEQSVPIYFVGHDDVVLQNYLKRTPQVYASYVLPYLKATSSVLDVGCGPGSITSGFKSFCPNGQVVGVDMDTSSIKTARKMFGSTATFDVANVYNLPFQDDSFDVVHSYNLLQHIEDIPSALKEMRRVMKPDGIMATRVVCTQQITASIDHKGLDMFYKAYFELTQTTGCDLDIMFHMPKLARQAGFTQVKMQASSNCFVDKDLEDYLQLVAGYLSPGEMLNSMKGKGGASDEEIEVMRDFVRVAMDNEDEFIMMPHLECVCTK